MTLFTYHKTLIHTLYSLSPLPFLGLCQKLLYRVTNEDENLNGEIIMKKKFWTMVYEKTHKPCLVGYKELDLSSNPIILKPGQVRGIYIHSTRRGDSAIVYDNKEKQKTHDDSFITILPGRAHVSEKAFGSVPIWGW